MRCTLTASLALLSILATTAAAQQKPQINRQPQGPAASHPTATRPVQPAMPKPPVSSPAPQSRPTMQHSSKISTKPTTPVQKSTHGSHGTPKSHDPASTKSNKLTPSTNKASTPKQTAPTKQTKDPAGSGQTPSDASGTINNNNINNNNTNVNVNVSNFNFGTPFFGGWAVGESFLWGGGVVGFWGIPATWTLGLWSPIREPIVLLP